MAASGEAQGACALQNPGIPLGALDTAGHRQTVEVSVEPTGTVEQAAEEAGPTAPAAQALPTHGKGLPRPVEPTHTHQEAAHRSPSQHRLHYQKLESDLAAHEGHG